MAWIHAVPWRELTKKKYAVPCLNAVWILELLYYTGISQKDSGGIFQTLQRALMLAAAGMSIGWTVKVLPVLPELRSALYWAFIISGVPEKPVFKPEEELCMNFGRDSRKTVHCFVTRASSLGRVSETAADPGQVKVPITGAEISTIWSARHANIWLRS